MKALIVYYSYTGNTKRIAQMIQNEIGGDIAEIETVVPYEGDYNIVVDQGHEEVNRGFMPQIKPLNVNIKDYDTVILGTPVWWYTFAPAVKTFLNNNDFQVRQSIRLQQTAVGLATHLKMSAMPAQGQTLSPE